MNFVHYSKVSFAQGLVTDHAPLRIAANYDRTRLRTMKLTNLTVLTEALLIYNIWIRIRGICELSGLGTVGR